MRIGDEIFIEKGKIKIVILLLCLVLSGCNEQYNVIPVEYGEYIENNESEYTGKIYVYTTDENGVKHDYSTGEILPEPIENNNDRRKISIVENPYVTDVQSSLHDVNYLISYGIEEKNANCYYQKTIDLPSDVFVIIAPDKGTWDLKNGDIIEFQLKNTSDKIRISFVKDGILYDEDSELIQENSDQYSLVINESGSYAMCFFNTLGKTVFLEDITFSITRRKL